MVGAAVVGAWALTWASHRLEDYLTGLRGHAELEAAERAYWLAREAAAEHGDSPLYDALVCQQLEDQFDA